ncbi:MAG: hypothetical protein M1831_006552 [Alyxoria varia]|nr:MAG: hypothetical protein M1831_006552 [Alyxoria varia]
MGFFLGTTLASATLFYYILDDYKLSNQLLNEDILALQASVERIAAYTQDLEAQVHAANKRSARSQSSTGSASSNKSGNSTPASAGTTSSSSSGSDSSNPLASNASQTKPPSPLESPGAVGEGQGTGMKQTA